MPLFIIETTARASIREFWRVTADSADDARERFYNGEPGDLLRESISGDEEDREIAGVHDWGDVSGAVTADIAETSATLLLSAAKRILEWIDCGCDPSAKAVAELRHALSLATGTPTGDDAATDEPEGLATYRITETVVYLVKAEDEAHAERRFVCEVGIHADCFHSVEGRTFELVEDGEEFTCTACGREESECSADPCPAVIEDRES